MASDLPAIAEIERLRLNAVEQSGSARWICTDERGDGTAQVYSPSCGPMRVIVPVAETSRVCGELIAAMFNALPQLLQAAREREEMRAEINEWRNRFKSKHCRHCGNVGCCYGCALSLVDRLDTILAAPPAADGKASEGNDD